MSLFLEMIYIDLHFQIETGRFSNTLLENRICKQCDLNHVENEYHFLFHCPLYIADREEFYNSLSLYPNITTTHDALKLKQLFVLEPRKLSKYACKIFEKRKNAEYNV